jgi:hypothetical protein
MAELAPAKLTPAEIIHAEHMAVVAAGTRRNFEELAAPLYERIAEQDRRLAAANQRISDMVTHWNSFMAEDGAWNNFHGDEGTFKKTLKGICEAAAERMTRIEDKAAGTMRYRGVYQRSDAYSKGDAVTADGSLFCAVRDSSGTKPGTNDDFQLVAKGGH